MTEPLDRSTLTAEDALDHTIRTLQKHIPLDVHGYRYWPEDLWRVVVAAAAQHTSIDATCGDLLQAPHANTVRDYLTAQWTVPQLPTWEAQLNAALQATLPVWLWERAHETTIDTHDEPYYGHHTPTDPNNWVCRGQAKAGTTRFYRCATAYLLVRDARMTLAVVFVKPGDAALALVQRLLDYLHTARLRVRCLYADKGFCTVRVLRYCQEQQIPAIIALPIRGKQGGTRALCQGQGSRWATYTLSSDEHGRVTVKVAVVRRYQRRREGTTKAVWLLYACVHVRDQAVRICQRYRSRFGVESSYRMLEQVRVSAATEHVLKTAVGRWPLISGIIRHLCLLLLTLQGAKSSLSALRSGASLHR